MIHMRRPLAAFGLLLASTLAGAQTLTLGVSEGTSGGIDHAQGMTKYQGLAEAIGNSLRQKVQVVFVREFGLLEEGMKTKRFDFVMARPSDYPARGLRDYGYNYVASAQPDGQCLVIVPKDSKITSLAQIKGQRIVMPEQVSYMSKLCRAELRDQGVDLAKENVKYVREQGAVVFYLENKFSDVGGVASYSGVAKKWEKDGQRVLHRSVAQPYFPLIAGPKISEAQVKAVQQGLLALPNDDTGRKTLTTIGIKEFGTHTEDRLRKLLGWLG